MVKGRNFDVEKILDKKINKKEKVEYKIKWVDRFQSKSTMDKIVSTNSTNNAKSIFSKLTQQVDSNQNQEERQERMDQEEQMPAKSFNCCGLRPSTTVLKNNLKNCYKADAMEALDMNMETLVSLGRNKFCDIEKASLQVLKMYQTKDGLFYKVSDGRKTEALSQSQLKSRDPYALLLYYQKNLTIMSNQN